MSTAITIIVSARAGAVETQAVAISSRANRRQKRPRR